MKTSLSFIAYSLLSLSLLMPVAAFACKEGKACGSKKDCAAESCKKQDKNLKNKENACTGTKQERKACKAKKQQDKKEA